MKDILIRAGKTFIQAFLGSLTLTIATADLTNMAVVKGLIISALAGGISALMNFILALLKK